MEWHQNTFLLICSTAPGHRKKYKLGQRRTRYEKRVKRDEIVRDRQSATGRIMTQCAIAARAHRGPAASRSGRFIAFFCAPVKDSATEPLQRDRAVIRATFIEVSAPARSAGAVRLVSAVRAAAPIPAAVRFQGVARFASADPEAAQPSEYPAAAVSTARTSA